MASISEVSQTKEFGTERGDRLGQRGRKRFCKRQAFARRWSTHSSAWQDNVQTLRWIALGRRRVGLIQCHSCGVSTWWGFCTKKVPSPPLSFRGYPISLCLTHWWNMPLIDEIYDMVLILFHRWGWLLIQVLVRQPWWRSRSFAWAGIIHTAPLYVYVHTYNDTL